MHAAIVIVDGRMGLLDSAMYDPESLDRHIAEYNDYASKHASNFEGGLTRAGLDGYLPFGGGQPASEELPENINGFIAYMGLIPGKD